MVVENSTNLTIALPTPVSASLVKALTKFNTSDTISLVITALASSWKEAFRAATLDSRLSIYAVFSFAAEPAELSATS